MPGDSAYSTSVREATTDEEWEKLEALPVLRHGRWSRTDHLLARVGDLLAMQIWHASDRATPPPEPLLRPGVRPAKADQRAFDYLNRVRELRGGHPDG